MQILTVNSRRDATDEGLLVANGASDRVVRPAIDGSLSASIQGGAVGRQGQSMVELGAGNEHAGAADAAVVAKGVHRDTPGGLGDQHVALRIPDDGPDLLQATSNLHGRPTRCQCVLVPEVTDTAARLR